MIEDEDLSLSELLAEVRRIEVQSRRLLSDPFAGGYASVFKGSGIEFSEVREYSEGDDPRSIDWNVTARIGRPFVKKFIDERELTVLFILDLSESMRAGFGGESSRHMAARFVALMGLAAARNHDKTGLIGFADSVIHRVPAAKGSGHVLRLIRDTLQVRSGPVSSDLGPVLDQVQGAQRRRAVIFLVSDFVMALPAKSLARLSARHDVIAVRLKAPEATAPRFGLMRLRDPESGIVRTVDWSSRRVRRAYANNVANHEQKVDEVLAEARIDSLHLNVPTVFEGDALVKPLLSFFRMREVRGSRR